MHPFYRHMDSFPHQRNQVPYPQHYYPSFEAIPPQMKVDTSRSPITYETWPYGGTYGHSIPMGCHGCCNHSYFPGYCGFRTPNPHYPPPSSPFNCQGGYPSFPPEIYPVPYVPPPHYLMEQPRYESDKDASRDHHCCGCSNHPCNRKEDRPVRIEEQEPDSEKKTSGKEKSSNSLVPVEFRNHPYPVAWIPPVYSKNKEPRNPQLKERHEDSHDTKQEPSVGSDWFPLDMNSLGSLKHGEDKKRTQNQLNEERNRFPFPIFWMPYKPEEKETRDHKEANAGQESAEKSPSNLKDTSAHFAGGADSINQSGAREEKFGSEVGSKTKEKKIANQKTIPVKQLEEQEEKRMTDEAEGKVIEGRETKPSENGTERQSLSPRKMSKLPPVCLRVDPLPKRKNGNGSSRSPSPPGHKRTQELSAENCKSTSPRAEENTQHDMQFSSCTLNNTEEVEPNERRRKVVEVVDGITRQDTGEAVKVDNVMNVKEENEARDAEEKKSGEAINSKDATIKGQSGDGQLHTGEDKGGSMAEKENPEEAKKAKRKNLSEAEAAVVIQSAYRGFEVRKLEPLKKLKQIAKLREQATEVRGHIEALESSLDISNENRQRVVIGETIMSLLLKLDTIQGLHPIVRDSRKSVAKELVSLQDRLDSLTTKLSEVPTAKLEGDLSTNTSKNASIQGEQKEAEVEHGNSISESNHDNESGSIEPCQGQVSHVRESTSDPRAVETSELKSFEKEVCEESEDKITSSPWGNSVDSGKAEAEPGNELKHGLNNQVMMLKTPPEDPKLELPVEPLPLVAEENVDSMVEAAMSSCLDAQLVALRGEYDQELAVEESKRNEQIGTVKGDVLQVEEVDSLSAFDITSTGGEVAISNQVQQPPDTLKEELVTADLEDESGREGDFELHQYAGAKQEELLAQAQGEVSHVDDHVETSNTEYDPLEDARLEKKELTVQTQGEEGSNMNEIHEGEASKLEELQQEHLVAENETHVGEASDPDVTDQPELSPAENETLGGEASLEVSPALNEIHSGQQTEDNNKMTNNEDNCCKENEVPTEETKECVMETKIIIGEENQELVEDRHELEGIESVAGNVEVMEQLCKSETAEEEALIATQFAPASAEQLDEVEGELFPISPTASQVSLRSDMRSESDQKLLEENEKLREMMEKLVEAGKEQLTAISNLSGRVKDLEKKLARKKKLRTRRIRPGSSCVKPSNDPLKGRLQGIAM